MSESGSAFEFLTDFIQHLYVAVTRARIRLFFIETDGNAVDSILELLTQDDSRSLVEVTRPMDANVSSTAFGFLQIDILTLPSLLRLSTVFDLALPTIHAGGLPQEKSSCNKGTTKT